MLTKTTSRFLSILIASVLLFSFTKPVYQANFSGTWALNTGKSELGQFGARGVATKIVVDQKADGVTTNKTTAGFNGGADLVTAEALTNDGKEVESTVFNGNGKRKAALKWAADGNTFTITYSISFGQGELTGSENWSMSADGKQMTVTNTGNFGGNEFVTKAVYDKQ
ncbi:MAG: hypothetical protein V4539_19360 [Bacteroidota bacterium]